tara:strand:+ start:503 stop:784 length:282 start_codon:yes stop_codon:yes gene_type:complete
MQVVKILGEATQVNAGSGSSVPDTNSIGAQYVMVQHDHASGNAHLVETRTGAGVTIGSFYIPPHNPIIVYKERTDLIFCSSNDVYATSVVYQG